MTGSLSPQHPCLPSGPNTPAAPTLAPITSLTSCSGAGSVPTPTAWVHRHRYVQRLDHHQDRRRGDARPERGRIGDRHGHVVERGRRAARVEGRGLRQGELRLVSPGRVKDLVFEEWIKIFLPRPKKKRLPSILQAW
jgi:hypothetical protein